MITVNSEAELKDSSPSSEEQQPEHHITLNKKVSDTPEPTWQSENDSTNAATYGQDIQSSSAYNAGNADASAPEQNTRFSFAPLQAFREFWGNYANFHGRTSRADYWLSVLFLYLTVLLYLIPSFVLPFVDCFSPALYVISIAAYICFYLAVAIPGLAIFVRRLHDIGKSGWFILLSLVPVVGSIIVFIFTLLPGEKVANKWGAPIDRNAIANPYDPQVKDSRKKCSIGLASVVGLPILIIILAFISGKLSGYGYDDYSYSDYSDYSDYSSSSPSSSASSSSAEPAPVYQVSDVASFPSEGYDGWYSSVEYVDLGLPSGLQWADRNVGATTPYYSGSYFNKDAAYEVWTLFYESGFSLPSVSAFKELRNYCKWDWVGGGYRITSKRNGNSIYFPAAGNIKTSSVRNEGTDGDYWAADFKSASRSYNLDFTSSKVTTNDNSPASMYFTVRLVFDPSNSCTDCD